MTDDRRNKLAAVMAEGDQNDAHYRDWLQSQSLAELDAMQEIASGLYRIASEMASGPTKLAALGVVVLAKHALTVEMTRRAELEVGGEK